MNNCHLSTDATVCTDWKVLSLLNILPPLQVLFACVWNKSLLEALSQQVSPSVEKNWKKKLFKLQNLLANDMHSSTRKNFLRN